MHQVDGSIAWTENAQTYHDVAILFARRFERCHLHSAGQNSFQILHSEGPRKCLLIEQIVQNTHLLKQLRISGWRIIV